jgi:Fe-S-cluster-containing hydrogenase component 2
MYARRNLSLCTKDCICLFICPTGATNTPTGQIDSERCLDGCRLCVDACPSHAIHLVMDNYAEPAPKDSGLSSLLLELTESKTGQEAIAETIAGDESQSPGARKLARALKLSCRILAEDGAREAGYLIPGCKASRDLIESLTGN